MSSIWQSPTRLRNIWCRSMERVFARAKIFKGVITDKFTNEIMRTQKTQRINILYVHDGISLNECSINSAVAVCTADHEIRHLR